MKAKELIYTGKIIDANEAKHIGLVNEVYPLEKIDRKVNAVASMILKNSKLAISASKKLIQQGIYESEMGFLSEEIIFAKRFASGEPQEKLKDMKQKIEEKKTLTNFLA